MIGFSICATRVLMAAFRIVETDLVSTHLKHTYIVLLFKNYHNREDYAGCKTWPGNSLLRHRMAAAMRLAPRSVTRYRRESLTLAIRP